MSYHRKEFSSFIFFFQLLKNEIIMTFQQTFQSSTFDHMSPRSEYCYSFWFINKCILHKIPRFCFHPSWRSCAESLKDIESLDSKQLFCILLLLFFKLNSTAQRTFCEMQKSNDRRFLIFTTKIPKYDQTIFPVI